MSQRRRRMERAPLPQTAAPPAGGSAVGRVAGAHEYAGPQAVLEGQRLQPWRTPPASTALPRGRFAEDVLHLLRACRAVSLWHC